VRRRLIDRIARRRSAISGHLDRFAQAFAWTGNGVERTRQELQMLCGGGAVASPQSITLGAAFLWKRTHSRPLSAEQVLP
jgi:hypothetical protein